MAEVLGEYLSTLFSFTVLLDCCLLLLLVGLIGVVDVVHELFRIFADLVGVVLRLVLAHDLTPVC